MFKQSVILQLQTFPAAQIGLTKFRKEVIKVGHYRHPDTKQEFDITIDVLNHWVATFNRYLAGGNSVPIPLGHQREGMPEANAGWVTDMVVEDNSLYCIMELSDPELSLTTDVSVCIEKETTDGKGIVYKDIITHVALCTNPVIVGLEKFTKLSLSIGEPNMEFLKKLAVKLGIKTAEPTEDEIMLALGDMKKPVAPVVPVVVTKVDPLVKLVSENRELKLSNLVKAGLITPAIKDVIAAKYVEVGVLTLSMASKQEDGFDVLYNVLVQNKPLDLSEVTGIQSLELSDASKVKPNVMQKAVTQKRKEAGLTD